MPPHLHASTHTQINPINPNPQPPSPSTTISHQPDQPRSIYPDQLDQPRPIATISHQPDQPRPTYPDQPDQPIPRSTHNPNQPRPSKPTQTKTDPHHKLILNHHRGLPTSLPSIINSNPHRHHRDHATRHASISPRCDPQR